MSAKHLSWAALFVVVGAWVGGETLQAQESLLHYSCCPPGAFCEYGIKAERRSPRSKNYVDSVTFDGPVSLTGTELQDLIASLKEKEFERDSDWLQNVEHVVLEPWRNQGYFMAKVTVQAAPVGGDDGRYAITAQVDEGIQYRLGYIDFRAVPGTHFETVDTGIDGPVVHRRAESVANDTVPVDPHRPVFPIEQLRAAIPMQDGDVFSARNIRYGLDALHKLYGEQGYMDMVADPLTDVDNAHQTVSIMFELDEQRQFRIGRLEVYGLDTKTASALV